jgi:hypothetical protein
VAVRILTDTGFENVNGYDQGENMLMDLGIYNIRATRMHRDSKTAMFNRNNQVYVCDHIFYKQHFYCFLKWLKGIFNRYFFLVSVKNHAAAASNLEI